MYTYFGYTYDIVRVGLHERWNVERVESPEC